MSQRISRVGVVPVLFAAGGTPNLADALADSPTTGAGTEYPIELTLAQWVDLRHQLKEMNFSVDVDWTPVVGAGTSSWSIDETENVWGGDSTTFDNQEPGGAAISGDAGAEDEPITASLGLYLEEVYVDWSTANAPTFWPKIKFAVSAELFDDSDPDITLATAARSSVEAEVSGTAVAAGSIDLKFDFATLGVFTLTTYHGDLDTTGDPRVIDFDSVTAVAAATADF